MASKKKTDAGTANHRKRGLRTVCTAIRPDVHRALTRAAALADPPEAVCAFTARELEAAARRMLAAHGLPWPA